MAKPYSGTQVNRYKSQEDIKKILHKEGIFENQFTDFSKKIVFRFKKEVDFEGNMLPLGVQIELPIPSLIGIRTQEGVKKTEAEINRRYRVLFWWLKSKFEAIHTDIYESVTAGFVKEFYPNLLFTDNEGKVSTLYNSLLPQFIGAIEGKRTDLKMLPDLEEVEER